MMKRRTLRLPKEHGAWAMLYVPFAVGAIVGGGFSLRVALLGLSATFMFIARESLLAWWRGRSRRQHLIEARQVMIVYLALGALFGAPLILVYKLYWLVPLGAATLGLLFLNAQQAVRREDRSIGGETIAILGLTLTAPAAYYAATEALDAPALWLWAACALYFTSSVFYVKLRVHSLNRRKKEAKRRSQMLCAFYHAALLGALVTFYISGSLSMLAIAAFAPALARSFWQLAKPSKDLNLRRIGVMEIVYSLVFLIFITMTFRIA